MIGVILLHPPFLQVQRVDPVSGAVYCMLYTVSDLVWRSLVLGAAGGQRVRPRRLSMDDVWGGNSLCLDGSRVIDRRIYLEEEIFEAEQKRIFAKTWQWVAHESELPEFGDYVTATIAGSPIVVARGDDDALNAFYNTCTHRGALVAAHPKGNCKGSFVCLYHGWCFDTEGKLAAVPLEEAYGDNLPKSRYDIPKIRLETFFGNIFVCLDDSAPPLVEFLGATAPYIQAFSEGHEVLGRVRWELEGNWKLWHENFRDNYHPMFAHAILGIGYQGVKILGENHDLSDGHSVMLFPLQTKPENIAPVVRKLTGRDIEAGEPPNIRQTSTSPPGADRLHTIMAVFPNLDFQFMSGGLTGGVLQTVRPVSLNKAIVEIVAYAPKGESEEAREARLGEILGTQTAAGKVSGDDNEAARRCSEGFGTIDAVRWSNMDRGQAPGSTGLKNDEYSLRSFYVAYKQYMGDVLHG